MSYYTSKKRLLIQALKSEKCTDCNKKYHWCQMDFDHIGNKSGNISTMSLGSLVKEINKCELVCSNCHRLRTYKRKQYCVTGGGRPKKQVDMPLLLESIRTSPSIRTATNYYNNLVNSENRISHTYVARTIKRNIEDERGNKVG